jgi:hypothetical protein
LFALDQYGQFVVEFWRIDGDSGPGAEQQVYFPTSHCTTPYDEAGLLMELGK